MMQEANEVVQSIKLSKAEKETIKAQKAAEAMMATASGAMISSGLPSQSQPSMMASNPNPSAKEGKESKEGREGGKKKKEGSSGGSKKKKKA